MKLTERQYEKVMSQLKRIEHEKFLSSLTETQRKWVKENLMCRCKGITKHSEKIELLLDYRCPYHGKTSDWYKYTFEMNRKKKVGGKR